MSASVECTTPTAQGPSPAGILAGYDWATLRAGTPEHVRARADLAALDAVQLVAFLAVTDLHPRARMMATAALERLAPRSAKPARTAPVRLAAWAEEV